MATCHPQGAERAACLCRQGTQMDRGVATCSRSRSPSGAALGLQAQTWGPWATPPALTTCGAPRPAHGRDLESLNGMCVCFRTSYKWLAFENQSRIIGSIKIMRWAGDGTPARVIHLASGGTGASQSRQRNGSSWAQSKDTSGVGAQHTDRHASPGGGKSVSCAGRRPLRRRQGMRRAWLPGAWSAGPTPRPAERASEAQRPGG